MVETQVQERRSQHSRKAGQRARLNPKAIKESQKERIENLESPSYGHRDEKDGQVILECLEEFSQAMGYR